VTRWRFGNLPAVADADDENLVWIDLEMTGLDVEQHVIVEIACIVTNSELETLDSGVDIVIHPEAGALDRMDDFVRNMHTKSGLLPEMESSTIDLATAGKAALDYVRSHVPERTTPVCGNSIGVDRRFLDHYLPELDQYLHYRSVDVSSIKELCRRWYPAIYKQRPSKNETHRALDDILESIEELRYYRKAMFVPPAANGATPSA
jgi:oligoribonuclease